MVGRNDLVGKMLAAFRGKLRGRFNAQSSELSPIFLISYSLLDMLSFYSVE